MLKTTSDPALIALSTAAYRLLLAFYPARFRREYGPHMMQVFRDCCLNAYRQSGLTGMLSLWALTLFDWFKTVIEEQFNRGTEMTGAKFIRLSGWALMLAALLLVAGFGIGRGETAYFDPLGGPDAFYEYGQLVLIPTSLLLYTLGMLGLRARYAGPSGWLGKTGLTIAAIAGGLSFLGSMPLFALIEQEPWVDGWWYLTFGSMLVMLVGLSLFGIAALQTRPLPRWNALPLLTAIWFPLVAVVGAISAGVDDYLALVALLFMFVGSMFLGYLLQKDAPANKPGTPVQA